MSRPIISPEMLLARMTLIHASFPVPEGDALFMAHRQHYLRPADEIISAHGQWVPPSGFVAYPTDDCYADKAAPAIPHNGASMVCTNYTLNRNRIPYLKFNITDLLGVVIETAKVYLYQDDNLPGGWVRGNVSAYKVVDDTWAEDTLTWNNRPALGAIIDTVNCADSNTWYNWDVKDYVVEELGAAETLISFGFNRVYAVQYSRFKSKEFDTLDPYLHVEYIE